MMDFAISVDHKRKIKESEKRDKYLDLAWEIKKLWSIWVMMIPIVIVTLGTVPKGLEKEVVRIGNLKTNWDHLNYNIAEIGQNSEKNPGNLRIFVIAPVKDHQLTLVRKTRQEHNNNNNNNSKKLAQGNMIEDMTQLGKVIHWKLCLIRQTNDIFLNQNLYYKMIRIKFGVILGYKRITQIQIKWSNVVLINQKKRAVSSPPDPV